MSVFHAEEINGLKDFSKRSEQLGLFERKVPKRAGRFFERLKEVPFGVHGNIHKDKLAEDIDAVLKDQINPDCLKDPFYKYWLDDMVKVCKLFCCMLGKESAGFWVGSKRGCRRYHVDLVPLRLLVTYAGKGTEWLPDKAADREAFENDGSNSEIVKDSSAIKFMNPWDIGIFRGGSKGLLHRTPDAALNTPSILMRLDHPSFWKNVEKASNSAD